LLSCFAAPHYLSCHGDVSMDGDADIVQEQVLMLDNDYARAAGGGR
jgi:hypothetical protein